MYIFSIKIDWLSQLIQSVFFIIGVSAIGYIHSAMDIVYWSIYRFIISILIQAFVRLYQEYRKSA